MRSCSWYAQALYSPTNQATSLRIHVRSRVCAHDGWSAGCPVYSTRLPQPAQCKLVIGERSGNDGIPPSLYVYERWLPLVLLLRHAHGGGGAP